MPSLSDNRTNDRAATDDPFYFRQLLAGVDFAVGNHLARQMANYVYAIGDRRAQRALLVDPAYAPEELIEILGRDGLELAGVVLTHYHADHAGGHLASWDVPGVRALLEHADVPVHVQGDEREWVVRGTGVHSSNLSIHASGDTIRVGDIDVVCVHTPGHTPGSQCVHVGGALVTGDTLFLDGCGRTDLPGGDPEALYKTLTNRLASIPDETTVFPGHAYSPEPSAAMGLLRQVNPVLAPLSQAEWLARFGL